ncbi:SDR family NAD(P)-dependent oxidoreductase [Bradyrhizobium sp. BRP19]|uniref:oxidoreductase n=1 Tax=Bradyrhizobium sp. BRP19 TaxID=2793823 RepID=UPI001CD1ACEB|nr:oxidoreductase [Bradyrhizobium sp. BRP19]MCA1551809.1 SDR family NAD(P)-dependent oxidoreductase [Bradyrhizobium sp. BRP19]
MTKTWFITGAARGLGAEVARAALAAGDNVVATARDENSVRKALGDNSDRTLFLSLDVIDAEAPRKAVDAAVARFGRIDVLVNNAGYGHLGLFEEASEEDIERQFETNVFGLMRVTRAVLPVMRRQKSGHIINLSSIGGKVAFDLCTLYGASKFAVEGFSVNLAKDVASFGINVTVVSPGYFRTDFLDPSSVRFAGNRIADYDQVRDAVEAAYKSHSHQQLGDPAKFGPAIVKMAGAEKPPVHFLVGSDAIEFARIELAARSAEIDQWADLSASTDHQDEAA